MRSLISNFKTSSKFQRDGSISPVDKEMPVEVEQTAQVSAVVIEVGDPEPETETDDTKKAQMKTKSQSSEFLPSFIFLSV